MFRVQPDVAVEAIVSYRVRIGMEYGGVRHKPGEIVTDVPADSVAVLLEQGAIERVEEVNG